MQTPKLKNIFQKNLNLHKSAETLPVAQWFYFHKYKEFRYFLHLEKNTTPENLPKISNKNLIEIQENYLNILYSINSHDLNIISHYSKLKCEGQLLDIENEINKVRKLTSRSKLAISYYKYEKTLHKYLNAFNNDSVVLFTEYFIRKDWKQHFKTLYENSDIPESLIELAIKLDGFYHYFQFDSAVKNIIKSPSEKPLQNLFLSEHFYSEFIQERKKEIDNLNDFANYLKEDLRENKRADLFYKVASELFDLNVMKSKPKENTDFWQEITAVKSELHHDFDIWSVPLAEYLSKIERLKAKRDIEEKFNKKQRANAG